MKTKLFSEEELLNGPPTEIFENDRNSLFHRKKSEIKLNGLIKVKERNKKRLKFCKENYERSHNDVKKSHSRRKRRLPSYKDVISSILQDYGTMHLKEVVSIFLERQPGFKDKLTEDSISRNIRRYLCACDEFKKCGYANGKKNMTLWGLNQ